MNGTRFDYEAAIDRITRLEALCAAKDKVIYEVDFNTVPSLVGRIDELESALRAIKNGDGFNAAAIAHAALEHSPASGEANVL